MGNLIKNGLRIEDEWLAVTDDQPLPDGKIVLSVERLLRDGEQLIAEQRPLGVRLEAGQEIEAVQHLLSGLSLVVLVFETFTDGRHYSTARLLRERHQFAGEVRAVGDVLRDQLLFMRRCGFDAFELRADQDLDTALKAFDDFSVRYQPAQDEACHIFRRRTLAARPATA